MNATYQDLMTDGVVQCDCGCGQHRQVSKMVTCDLCGNMLINDKDHIANTPEGLWTVCTECDENGTYRKAMIEQIWNLEASRNELRYDLAKANKTMRRVLALLGRISIRNIENTGDKYGWSMAGLIGRAKGLLEWELKK